MRSVLSLAIRASSSSSSITPYTDFHHTPLCGYHHHVFWWQGYSRPFPSDIPDTSSSFLPRSVVWNSSRVSNWWFLWSVCRPSPLFHQWRNLYQVLSCPLPNGKSNGTWMFETGSSNFAAASDSLPGHWLHPASLPS